MELSPRDTHDVFRLPPGAGRAQAGEANQPFRPLLRQFLSIGILVLSQLKKVQKEDLQRHKETGKMFFKCRSRGLGQIQLKIYLAT